MNPSPDFVQQGPVAAPDAPMVPGSPDDDPLAAPWPPWIGGTVRSVFSLRAAVQARRSLLRRLRQPARVAALMASERTAAVGPAGGTGAVDTALMQNVPEAHVHNQLARLAGVRPGLG